MSHLKNKSILWRWTLSYLCLLFIPMLTIFINYVTSLTSLKKEYTSAYRLELANYNTILNNKISAMQNFYHYITNLESFYSIIKYQEKDNYFYNTSYYLQTALSQHKYAAGDLDCTIYLSQVDFIPSSSNSCRRLLYYQYLQDLSSLLPEFESWREFMSDSYSEDLLISTNLSVTASPCLIYANTLHRGQRELATIFISCPFDTLFPSTGNLQDGISLILQATDNQLYCLDDTGIRSANDMLSSDSSRLMASSKDYVLIGSEDAPGSNFACYLLIRTDTFHNHLQDIRCNFVINIGLTLLLSILLMIYMIHSNYRPVTDLLTAFDLKNTSGNEFSNILTGHKKLQEDFSKSRRTIQYQHQALMNNRLLSLLKGRINEPELTQFMCDRKISTDCPCALIGFMISPSNQQDIEYDELIFFIVNNVFCDLFPNDTFYHIEDGRFIYYLFASESLTAKDWYENAYEKTNCICSLINDKFTDTIVASISETASGLMHCKFLYKKIMESFELQSLVGGNSVVNTFSDSSRQSYDIILESINSQLYDAIKSGDFSNAHRICGQLFASLGKLSFSAAKAIIFGAFSNIIELYNTYTTDSIQQVNALNYVGSIMQSETLDDLSRSFQEFVTFICGEISRIQQTEVKEIIINIRNFITENYTSQNLSVSSIADHLERNSKYISRLFKEDTGIGLWDYINQYRICQAKKLMQSKEYSFEKIAEMVGYANVQTFRRAFVKFTGENPSKFSKIPDLQHKS